MRRTHRAANALLDLTDPRIPEVARNSRIDVSLRARFVCWRVPKAANSTVLRTLMAHDPGRRGDLPEDSMRESKKRAYAHPLEHGRIAAGIARRRNRRIAFVRHPVHRLVSTYADKVEGRKRTAAPYFAWLGAAAPSFSSFVRFLEDGRLYDDPHWAPQVALVPDVRSLDVLGKVERIEDDLRRAIELIWPEQGWLGVQTWVPHATGAPDRATSLVDETSLERISFLYAADFAAFDYPLRPS